MSDDRRQVVTGTIGASPAEVFAVLADPSRHTEVDGVSAEQMAQTIARIGEVVGKGSP